MIEVLRAGALTTIQDFGRPGLRHLGISSGGALDPISLALANYLVGNPADAAVLEITFGRAAFRFPQGMRIALTGAECHAQIDGVPLPAGWSTYIEAGQTLKLNAPWLGVRTYLAPAGGIDVPLLLGSRATDLRAGFGGLNGRALANGDVLEVTPGKSFRADEKSRAARFGIKPFEELTPFATSRSGDTGKPVEPIRLRVLRGPEYISFSAAAQAAFWQHDWCVTPNSNRMGYRLAGTALHRERPRELLSHAVLPGTIQVPPDGAPIILMADAQTAGGYPKIGAVIMADLWRLAQIPLGGTVCFVESSVDEAQRALLQIRLYLKQVALTLGMRDEIRPGR